MIALIAYGLGIVFGCCWAQSVWGAAWRWDPREAFTLLTLGIGTIWYVGSGRMGGSFRLLTHKALVASLAFWFIVLMYSLAGIYAARLHTYGFPSRAPSIIACLLVINLSILAAGHLRIKWGFNS
jgi:ABC-type transport system involved in cytochrome c biogenesis permease subunit